MYEYCDYQFEDSSCDLPPLHGGNHVVDGKTIIESLQPFDEWADDNNLDEEERSVLFQEYVELMTGGVY
jgi:hypothetical protein